MKKIILVFLLLSVFFLVWCNNNLEKDNNTEKYVPPKESDIDFPSYECNDDMKLWKNKLYNFKICIPTNWAWINAYKWNLQSISDIEEMIWLSVNPYIYLDWDTNNSLWEYDKKSKFWDKEIIEHYFINNDWKKEFSDFNYTLKIWKDKYYRFSFDKKTDEMKDIINSIKSLTEK
jgi:hypothetical protein